MPIPEARIGRRWEDGDGGTKKEKNEDPVALVGAQLRFDAILDRGI